MNKVNRGTAMKKWLLIIALVGLCIPFVKYFAEPTQEKALRGSYTVHPKAIFSFSSWFDGSYQPAFDRFFNQNFCLNATFIELNNQLLYSFFHEATAKAVVVGSENYLFEDPYIKAYLGKDFIGESKIDSIVIKLKYIQEYLKKSNSEFVLVIAPNKARVFENYFPREFKNQTASNTNYEYFKKRLTQNNIQFIDVISWFDVLKDNNKFLYTKYGTHWSTYAAAIATDSLFKFVANKKGLQTAGLVIDSLTYSKDAQEYDNDIAYGLNLFFELPKENYCYPNYHLQEDSTFHNLNWLAIGDSFYWNIYNILEKHKVVNKHAYWYYNKLVYPESYTKQTLVSPELISGNMKKHDVVVLITSEPNIVNLPYDIDKKIGN
jgi:hypothetical protein